MGSKKGKDICRDYFLVPGKFLIIYDKNERSFNLGYLPEEVGGFAAIFLEKNKLKERLSKDLLRIIRIDDFIAEGVLNLIAKAYREEVKTGKIGRIPRTTETAQIMGDFFKQLVPDSVEEENNTQ